MVSHGFAGKSPFGGMPGLVAGSKMRSAGFPLIPPGICGARFLRQQEAGAIFLRASSLKV